MLMVNALRMARGPDVPARVSPGLEREQGRTNRLIAQGRDEIVFGRERFAARGHAARVDGEHADHGSEHDAGGNDDPAAANRN